MYIINFVINQNFDLTQSLSILDTVPSDTQFLSIHSYILYSVSVDTQFLHESKFIIWLDESTLTPTCLSLTRVIFSEVTESF